MSHLFAVFRARGPQWQDGRPLEDQVDWALHADFMDALQAEGFVLLGGPLEGANEAMLIVRATDVDEVRSRLADDVWERKSILATPRVVAWTLRLGSLG